jgi:RNA polymerase sigma factor (sigma-70 family)
MGGVRGSDRELIRGCKRGERRAWERVMDEYQRLVFSIPRSYGLSREDAADVSQLTFTILIQSLDSLTEESNLKAWLATVARRHTWRVMEKGRRERPGREDDLADTPWLLGDEKPSERWELIDWLDQGLAKISEPCRRLLKALYLDEDEPSYADISERLDMPIGSIGPTRARCLQRLRASLGDR